LTDDQQSNVVDNPFDFSIDSWEFPQQLAAHLKLAKAGRPWVYIQATLRPGPDNGGAAGYAIWEAIATTDRSIVWASQHYADGSGHIHTDLLGGMRIYPLATVKTFNFRTPTGGVANDEENVPIDLYVGSEVVPITVGVDPAPNATTEVRFGCVGDVLEAVVASWGGSGLRGEGGR
jgi:hypothetical protein